MLNWELERGWGDGSVDQVPDTQASRYGFGSLASMQKVGLGMTLEIQY